MLRGLHPVGKTPFFPVPVAPWQFMDEARHAGIDPEAQQRAGDPPALRRPEPRTGGAHRMKHMQALAQIPERGLQTRRRQVPEERSVDWSLTHA